MLATRVRASYALPFLGLASLAPASSPMIQSNYATGLTPRPTSVAGVRNPVLNLNGTWTFQTEPGGKEHPIQVPGEWAMQGFSVPEKGWAVYRRTLSLPKDWTGHPVQLRFDGVHSMCEVKLNGAALGTHQGGFVPFQLDATRSAHAGENILEVRVQCESMAEMVSCISQYASHEVGGIVRKVQAFALPSSGHIERLKTHTVVPNKDRAELHTTIEVTSSRELMVNATLYSPFGARIASKRVPSNSGEFSLVVDRPQLWTSETPSLYTLETQLIENNRVIQTVKQRVGLREVKLEGNIFRVNGNPVKLLGVDRHEVHPLLGRSITPELCRKDVELFRAANINVIRTSHYPPSEEFLEACDELGMFVECEAAICWVGHNANPRWEKFDRTSNEFDDLLSRPSQDMIAAYREHPSIIMWSLANESVWSPLFMNAYDRAKASDSSRPVSFHDQCWGDYNNAHNTTDIANYHYPSENNAHMWSEESRPVWFGEYAHVECYNRHELVTDPWIREDWGRPVQRMVDLIWSQPGCVGGCIWSGIDDVFHMPNGDIIGYGHWGPIDAWRRPKPEYTGLKNAYSPVRILKMELTPKGETKVTVQNRFNFLNLSQTRIEWKTPRFQGTISAELAPHAQGILTLPHGSLLRGEPVEIIVHDQRGLEVVHEILYPAGRNAKPLPWTAATAIGPNGLLKGASWVLPAPVPIMLALNSEGGTATEAGSKLANVIEPFTQECLTWKVSETTSEPDRVVLHGQANEVKGSITMEKAGDRVRYSYDFEVLQAVNPRQWGLVFTLPRNLDTLSWDRNSTWSSYGPDEIGRPNGTAKANPSASKLIEEVRKQPKRPYSQDATQLGTNDFRSTKAHIHWAALTGSKGSILVLSPDASASTRAWVDGTSIKLLVAAFNTGGSDGFFSTHYSKERRPLKIGDRVHGSFEVMVR